MNEPVDERRPVVLHYHFFKNAGSSIDRTLRDNFAATWSTLERSPRIKPDALLAHLIANPWVAALSSHTADLPPPEADGLRILPIIMIRHPLDRVRSVYEFERTQRSESEGAVQAKSMSMPEFVAWRLERHGSRDRSFANFQVHHLTGGGGGSGRLDDALAFIHRLPFIGLVEAYDDSLQRLEPLMQELFPNVDLTAYRQNVGRRGSTSLERRLLALREQLGDPLYHQLVEANELDLALWEDVRAMYPAPPEPAADVPGMAGPDDPSEQAADEAAPEASAADDRPEPAPVREPPPSSGDVEAPGPVAASQPHSGPREDASGASNGPGTDT